MLNPYAVFTYLYDALTDGLTAAIVAATQDTFQAGELRPWEYYAGVVAGGALSTSYPGATLAFYAAAEAIDILVLKSPEGSSVDLFLDGVAVTTITTYSASMVWDTVNVNLGDRLAKVELRNNAPTAGNPNEANPWAWMAIGGFSLIAGEIITDPYLETRQEFPESPPWTVTMTFTDGKGKKSTTQFHYPYFAELSEVENYVYNLADTLYDVIEGRVTSASISKPVNPYAELPPQANADREQKMRYQFSTVSGAKPSINIPTWNETYTSLVPFVKKLQRRDSLAPQVASLRDMLTAAESLGYPSNPCDARGAVWRSITKSEYKFRKTRS